MCSYTLWAQMAMEMGKEMAMEMGKEMESDA
jgi:hypothetical protein